MSATNDELGGRPLLAVLLPIPHALFGLHAAPQVAMAIALAVAASVLFYLVLGMLEMSPMEAGAISTLALLFPWSDSTRLWATAGVNNIALVLFFGGVSLALRGRR